MSKKFDKNETGNFGVHFIRELRHGIELQYYNEITSHIRNIGFRLDVYTQGKTECNGKTDHYLEQDGNV